MNNFNAVAFAQQMIQANPQIAQNPHNRAMVEAIMNNDAQAGVTLANNLLNTCQVNKNDGLNQAMSYFQNMMQGGPR